MDLSIAEAEDTIVRLELEVERLFFRSRRQCVMHAPARRECGEDAALE